MPTCPVFAGPVTYVGGKHHKSPFPTSGGTCSNELLGLVHSDVCDKINT